MKKKKPTLQYLKNKFTKGEAINVEFKVPQTDNQKGKIVYEQYDGIITHTTKNDLKAKFTDGTTETFKWSQVQGMAECFTIVKERKRIAVNVIYEIDKAKKVNKENSQLLNWNFIKKLKKINMSFQKTNGDIAFYEAKITTTATEQVKLEFEGHPSKKKSHKLFSKAQFFEAVKKRIIRSTLNEKWWEILKIPKTINQVKNIQETEQKKKIRN